MMTVPEPRFLERSKAESRRFLQSAVVVDDLARLGDERIGGALRPPRRGTAAESGVADRQGTAIERRRATHDLDAKMLVDAFADEGMVCAALRPRMVTEEGADADDEGGEGEELDEVLLRTDLATKRADIVILDWNIPPESEPGRNARALIGEILGADGRPSSGGDRADVPHRLRLIAVYTGEQFLAPIGDKLEGLCGELSLPGVVRDGCTIRAGAVTIVIYSKDKGVIEGDSVDRRVGEAELPRRLIDDFTSMTAGLLSNVALASLSAVRDNTHRVLTRFGAHVDPPYVSHRAMMYPPEEAAEHPVPLIAAEIEGVLADAPQIRDLVGPEVIADWLDDLTGVSLGDGLAMSSDDFKAQLVDLLAIGLDMHSGSEGNWKQLVARLREYRDRGAAGVLSRELGRHDERGLSADLEFAVLTSVRSQYEQPVPVLRLGTVVAIGEPDSRRYGLCIQPLCDSVRVSGKRAYPFLKLKERDAEGDDPFEIVVSDRREFRRLGVSLRAYDIQLIPLKADRGHKSVVAVSREGEWMFEGGGSARTVRWVADLKVGFAQRIANQFAAEISRVGLTESEWLRRMGRRYPPP